MKSITEEMCTNDQRSPKKLKVENTSLESCGHNDVGFLDMFSPSHLRSRYKVVILPPKSKAFQTFIFHGKRDLDHVCGHFVVVASSNPKLLEKDMEGKQTPPPPPPLIAKEDFKTIRLMEKFHYRARDIFDILMDKNRWKGFTQSNAKII
jgi:hypothetical protein